MGWLLLQVLRAPIGVAATCLGVPENVSVTGMGSTNYGINTLKITSVIYDYVKTGSEGAKMLLNILDNKTKSEKISVPYRFFRGNTVKKI